MFKSPQSGFNFDEGRSKAKFRRDRTSKGPREMEDRYCPGPLGTDNIDAGSAQMDKDIQFFGGDIVDLGRFAYYWCLVQADGQNGPDRVSYSGYHTGDSDGVDVSPDDAINGSFDITGFEIL